MSDAEQKGSERRTEQAAVRTTIVGGRPPGAGKPVGDVPRGIEVLVKKAAVDAEFRRLLLEMRAEAAKTIGLELRPSEIAMIEGIPQAQLEAIISQTKVDAKLRPILMGAAAAVMLVALGADLVGCSKSEPPKPGGSRPDQPPSSGAVTSTTEINAPRPVMPVEGGSRPQRPEINPAETPPAPADTDAVVTPPPAPPNPGPMVGGVRPDRPGF